jgi:TPP-dependent pyruvate/acetoin dehydrogenase alpha subunit
MTGVTAPRTERVSLYTEMLRIRMVEERIAELYGEQEMRCPVHLCIGQEATAVGVCTALERSDYVLGTHRSHGHYLAKGGSLRALVAELYGKEGGCCGGKGGSMHLVDRSAGFLGAVPIVASTLPIAVGAAFGSVLQGESRVTVVFFGEGATEEGVFQESLIFAALKSLPVVFVCENNLYSVYSPLSVRQPPDRDIVEVARANGLQADRGDGNDVEAVRDSTSRAVARARAGEGPTLLEFATYRWREHCGPSYDNDLDYRTEDESEEWHARCPVEGLRRRLAEEADLAPGELERITAGLDREIDDAFRFARESPFPADDQLHAGVYA